MLSSMPRVHRVCGYVRVNRNKYFAICRFGVPFVFGKNGEWSSAAFILAFYIKVIYMGWVELS